MRLVFQEDAGRIRKRRANARQRISHSLKRLDLPPVDRIFVFLGADEMTHQQRGREILQVGIAVQRHAVGDAEAQPVHAGIHMDGGLELLRLRAAEARPFGDILR